MCRRSSRRRGWPDPATRHHPNTPPLTATRKRDGRPVGKGSSTKKILLQVAAGLALTLLFTGVLRRGPQAGRLRPRYGTDPPDLKSPYAAPAFAYLNSVAVTYRHIYVLGAFNNRLMRNRMDYRLERACPVS